MYISKFILANIKLVNLIIPLRHALQLKMTYVFNQFIFKLTYHVTLC